MGTFSGTGPSTGLTALLLAIKGCDGVVSAFGFGFGSGPTWYYDAIQSANSKEDKIQRQNFDNDKMSDTNFHDWPSERALLNFLSKSGLVVVY